MKSRNTPPLHSGKTTCYNYYFNSRSYFCNSYISIHFITRNREQQILFQESLIIQISIIVNTFTPDSRCIGIILLPLFSY